MKKYSYGLFALSLLVMSACKFDDGELWDKVHSLESRVQSAESNYSAINTETTQLNTIAKNLNDGIQVENVISNDGKTTIQFTNGTSVSVSDGISPYIGDNGNWWIDGVDTSVGAEATDGTDGLTISLGKNGNWVIDTKDTGIAAAAVHGIDAPVMGIKKNSDGKYYWTTTYVGKTDWVVDAAGKKIVAGGANGMPPVMRVNAEGYWIASFDGGISFSPVMDADGSPIYGRGVNGKNGLKGDTGDAGYSIFKTVYTDPSTAEVVFVMVDGNTYRFMQSNDISRLEDVIVINDGLGAFDLAHVSKEGYFLYTDDWTALASSATRASYDKNRLISFLSNDMSTSATIFLNSKDSRPTRVAFDTWSLEISYLDGSLAELIYSDKAGVKYLTTIEYDYSFWDLEMRSAGIANNSIKAAQYIMNKLLYTLAIDFKDVEILLSASKAQLSKASVNISSTSVTLPKKSTGEYVFVNSAVKESVAVIVDVAYTINMWTGKATFKVGGSSCTLEGSVLCSLDTYNDYGIYGMVCDENISNLFTERAEYQGTGYQNKGETYYEVDIRGLKPNTTYYYRSYYKFNGSNHGPFKFRYDTGSNIYYDTDIKSFKTGDNVLNVDVVMCIDVTGSMSGIINTVKRNALGFYDAFKQCCNNKKIILSSLSNQVIYFRDLNVDRDWIGTSPTYQLPDQSTEFRNYVNKLSASGGGDEPESGLEALSKAFSKSDFGIDDGYHRQVIILWTDAHYLVGNKYTSYTASQIEKEWNLLPSGRRLILFAPNSTNLQSNCGSWNVMDSWKNVIHINDLNSGFNSLNFILENIVEELTGKGSSAPARAPLKAAENPDYFFRPNY